MRYFKRVYSEVIQRFNRDWAALEWYYFEVDESDYAGKQMQIDHLGRVLKYDWKNTIEDRNGGLAEGALDLYQYTAIDKEEFFQIWDRQFTNEFVIENLRFNDQWIMSWYNLNINTTEDDLKQKELIICGVFEDYLLELQYLTMSKFYALKISQTEKENTYTTCTEWTEMANVAQIWIDKIEKM